MGWGRWFVFDSCGCPTGVDVDHKTADRAFNFLRTTLARPATRDGVEIVIDNRIDLSIHVQLLMLRFALALQACRNFSSASVIRIT